MHDRTERAPKIRHRNELDAVMVRQKQIIQFVGYRRLANTRTYNHFVEYPQIALPKLTTTLNIGIEVAFGFNEMLLDNN